MKRLLLSALVAATAAHAATQITWKRQQLHGDFYSEGAAIGDINGDGKPDIVAGPFWWEGPAFEKKHAFYEPKIFSINGYSDNFFAYVHDFNADQRNDILILGFPGKEARLYLNNVERTSKSVQPDANEGTNSEVRSTYWPMHIVADVVDNESPVFTDITGDDKPEIVCSTAGWLGWFEPDWDHPTQKWHFTGCQPGSLAMGKFTHGLGVGDVNGDCILDILEARRWWEQPKDLSWYEVPFTGGYMSVNFHPHTFAAGVGGGAQMFAYDFDGNGTNDIFTSLSAHRYGVAVFLQNKHEERADPPAHAENNKNGAPREPYAPFETPLSGPNWTRIMLASEQPQDNDYGIVFSQPHAAHLADIDGDGIKDIVTGKRYWAHNGHDPDERGARVIYWYQTVREATGVVDFVPHLVDAESGVGVDVQVGDVNGDKLPDIVVGNKAGVYILTQERKEISDDAAELMRPKKLYGAATSMEGRRVVGQQPTRKGDESSPLHKPSGLISQAEYAKGQSPADALKSLQLPGGFKAELIAAEPDVVQPIAFTFDERGRIWVVEGNSYPQPREVGKGQDRIKILEDKDGDGSFETKKIFCEGLNLVSGIELGFGGVWIGAAPYLMFIPDKDRNDQPDPSDPTDPRPQVPGLPFTAHALLDGWGTQDTHETLNSFIWGPDGWLYGCHGVFTHSRVGKPGTPDDQRTPINAGVWRYHPLRHEFEVFAHGTSNPWGLDYDQHGEWFVTACVIPHLYHIVPGGRYQRQAGQHFNTHTYEDIKTIADHAHYAGNPRPDVSFDKTTGAGVMNNDTNALGGGHAHCGLAIYQSSLFPQTYRNQLLFGNLHGHRLVANYTDVKGSTFIGKHAADFMRANDMHFIPVTQKVGPDGALYVSDWSDQQICHRGSGAVEHWDRSNGRIYRISYAVAGGNDPDVSGSGGSTAGVTAPGYNIPAAPFDLAKESDETLARLAVQTENEWFSRMARRVLMEQRHSGDDLRHAATAFIQAIQKPTSSAERIRASWALLTINESLPAESAYSDKTDEDLLIWAIRNEYQTAEFSKARASSNPYQLAAYTIRTPFESLLKLPAANTPRVRRELASALQRLPQDQRHPLATALLKHGEDKDDPMIPLLIWYGIEPVVAANAAVGMQLAKVSKMPKVTGFIYRRLASEDTGRQKLLSLAADSKDPQEQVQMIAMVTASARAERKATLPDDWAVLSKKFQELPRATQFDLWELEAMNGISDGLNNFRHIAFHSGKSESETVRGRALQVLLRVGDTTSLTDILTAAISADFPPQLRRQIIQGLAFFPNREAAEQKASLRVDWVLRDVIESKRSPAEVQDAVNSLSSWPTGAKTLLEAIRDKTVPATALSPFLVRQLTAFDDAEVNALIKSAWGDVNAPKADLGERSKKYKQLLTPAALAKGDLAKGKMLYTATCGQCHKLFGEGQNVGPDITGSNRADLNYLLENVLDPNAVIGKAYQLNLFTMKDGRVMSGVIKDESSAAVKIAMMGGVEFTLPVADIAKREVSKLSTMPEGLFDALQPEMVVDLVKYLQSGVGASAKMRDPRTLASSPTIPGALEGESLKVLEITGGNARKQGMAGFGDNWSGAAQLWWTGGKPDQKLTLAIPVKDAGKYTLYGALTMARDYGVVSIALDGKPVASSFDGYNAAKVVHTGEKEWGTHELTAGEHKLTLTLAPPNPDAVPSNMVGLDYVRLERR